MAFSGATNFVAELHRRLPGDRGDPARIGADGADGGPAEAARREELGGRDVVVEHPQKPLGGPASPAMSRVNWEASGGDGPALPMSVANQCIS